MFQRSSFWLVIAFGLLGVVVGGRAWRSDSDERATAQTSTISIRPTSLPAAEHSPKDRVTSLLEAEDHNGVLLAFRDWLEEDPSGALGFLTQIPPPLPRSHFAITLSEYFLTLAPNEALSLAALLEPIDHEVHLAATLPTFQSWAQQAPDEALAWLVESKKTNYSYEASRTRSFGPHQNQIDSFLRLPEGPARESLITGALEAWLASAPDEAIAYLNEAPESSDFDRAAFNYLDTFITLDPLAAQAWAQTLTTPSLRAMADQEIATARRNACPSCQLLYSSSVDQTTLRQPVDHHAQHSQ